MANINAPNVEITAYPSAVADGDSVGAIFGNAVTDKIAFYGRIPWSQKTPTVGLNSSYVGALATATSTGTIWGANSVSVIGTASTYYVTSVATATLSVGSNVANVVAEVVNTLIGLGVWKAASV